MEVECISLEPSSNQSTNHNVEQGHAHGTEFFIYSQITQDILDEMLEFFAAAFPNEIIQDKRVKIHQDNQPMWFFLL